jgi:hypothetical protein
MKACSREYCSRAQVDPDAPKICDFDRSGATWRFTQLKLCHPDRSEVEGPRVFTLPPR